MMLLQYQTNWVYSYYKKGVFDLNSKIRFTPDRDYMASHDNIRNTK